MNKIKIIDRKHTKLNKIISFYKYQNNIILKIMHFSSSNQQIKSKMKLLK